MTTNYQQEALEALEKCGAKMTIKLSNTRNPDWDKENRHDHYRVKVSSEFGSYTLDFYQSIAGTRNGEVPNEYDVLACLDFNVPESFEDFCDEFGYDPDPIKAQKTWKACLVQSRSLNKVFPLEAQRNLLTEIR